MNISEIFRMAIMAIRTNKLRSILTMAGVTIGVFSVIGVMTALNAIRGSIETGLSFLGSNIFQFAKYPVINSSDPEEKFANRRNIVLGEAVEFRRLMADQAQAIALKCFDGGKSVSYGRTKLQGLTVVGTNEAFLAANSYSLAYGRNISAEDVDLGRPVTVVGQNIQKKLFPNESPINKTSSARKARRSGRARTISCSFPSRNSSPTSAARTERSTSLSSPRRRPRTTRP
jgi:putative ABC transport system permease protein